MSIKQIIHDYFSPLGKKGIEKRKKDPNFIEKQRQAGLKSWAINKEETIKRLRENSSKAGKASALARKRLKEALKNKVVKENFVSNFK